jgi:hypothetical protein
MEVGQDLWVVDLVDPIAPQIHLQKVISSVQYTTSGGITLENIWMVSTERYNIMVGSHGYVYPKNDGPIYVFTQKRDAMDFIDVQRKRWDQMFKTVRGY